MKKNIRKLRYPQLFAEFYILVFSSLGNYSGNKPSEIKVQFNIWRKQQSDSSRKINRHILQTAGSSGTRTLTMGTYIIKHKKGI